MQNQPMQLDRKQFQELLKEIKMYNKIDLVAQGFQTKYAKETAGEDDDQRKKDAAKTNELLEKILESFSNNNRNGIATPARRKALSKAVKEDDEDRPRTLKEDLQMFKGELKTGVAFGKRIGGGIKDAVLNPVQTLKKVASGVGQAAKFSYEQGQDILSTPADYQRSNVAAVSQPSAKQVIEASGKTDNPNVVNEPDEIIAQETEKQSATFKELLDVTKQSLDQLKAIRGAVEGAPATKSAQPTSKTKKDAPVAAAPAAAEEGGGSMIGDAIGGKVMKGVGGKVLGGLKAGGAMLGKGVLAAGKLIGGAALAKPALIAGAVGLAAYGAYKGYKALTSGGEGTATGADPELEKAKTSKQAEALQKLASEGKYTFSGEGRNVNVFNKETGELVQTIQAPDRISGKELIEAAGVGGGLGTKAEPPKGQEVSSAEAKMLSRREEQGRLKPGDKEKLAQFRGEPTVTPAKTVGGTDPTGMGDDSEYKPVDTGSLRQGQQGHKAQHEQFMKDTKPGSGYKEAAVSQKSGFGDKIGSFFGGIKESVVGAAGKVGAAVSGAAGAAGASISGAATGIKDKVVGTAQYVKDEYNRDLSGKVGVPMSEMRVSTESRMQDEDSVSREGTLEKRDMQSGIVAQKSLFGSSFLGGLFSKKGQTTGQFSSDQAKDERFTGDATALGVGSDVNVDYEKRKSSSLLGERISSGSIFKRDKYKVTDTESGQELQMSKDEYNKMQALVKEGKAEEAKKMFDEVNAREAAYVPETGITPEEQMVAPSKGASNLAAVKDVRDKSIENAAMKDEMAAGGKTTQPVVVSSVNNNSQNNFIPIKGEPRPGSRGSALDRYSDRVAAY